MIVLTPEVQRPPEHESGPWTFDRLRGATKDVRGGAAEERSSSSPVGAAVASLLRSSTTRPEIPEPFTRAAY